MSASTSKKTYRKEYPYDKVALAKPRCPRCAQLLNTLSVGECWNCHFSMGEASSQYPFEAPALDTVSDFAKCLSAGEREAYEASLAKISKKYPQFSFTFCLCELDERTHLNEFGFWLLNSCPEVRGRKKARIDSTILLMFDTRKKGLSVTKGYAVEAYLPDEVLGRALKEFHQYLLRAEHENAAIEVRKAFLTMLKCSQKEMKRKGLKS